MPTVNYYGGPIISSPQVVSVFLNVEVHQIVDAKREIGAPGQGPIVLTADWTGDPNLVATSLKLNSFLTEIMPSNYILRLGEYDIHRTLGPKPGSPSGPFAKKVWMFIGQGALAGTVQLRTTTPVTAWYNGSNTDAPSLDGFIYQIGMADIELILRTGLDSGAVPKMGGNGLYCVFTPPGIDIGGFGEILGHHFNFPYGLSQIVWAVIQHPIKATGATALPIHPMDSDIFAVTGTTTHEIVEAITNPIDFSGWHSNNDEIADICAPATFPFGQGGYPVAKFWSERDQQCVDYVVTIMLKADARRRDRCLRDLIGSSVVEGEVATFVAVVEGIDPRSQISYRWSLSSGSPAGPVDGSTFDATMPAASSAAVEVELFTEVSGQPGHAIAQFKVISQTDADNAYLICWIRDQVERFKIPLFPDGPDPGPEIRAFRSEVQRLLALANQLEVAYGASQGLWHGWPSRPSSPNPRTTGGSRHGA